LNQEEITSVYSKELARIAGKYKNQYSIAHELMDGVLLSVLKLAGFQEIAWRYEDILREFRENQQQKA